MKYRKSAFSPCF